MKHITIGITSLFFVFSSILFSQTTTLEKLNTYDIGNRVEEPSGLAFDGEFLYTVSDNASLIYKYNVNGVFQEEFETDLEDLEGITNFGNNTLLLAIESSNTLVEYNYTNETLNAYPMTFENNDTSGGSGIEGVTYDIDNNKLYFLNEKDPGALIVANSITFEVTNEYLLDFAGDYSGVFYVSETDELWITSDNEGLLYRCNLTGEVIETINPNIDTDDKLEGIAVDYPNKLLYLVTDAGQNLIKYSFSSQTSIENTIDIESVTAVGSQEGNGPEEAINGDTGVTDDRWAAESNDGSAYITFNLGCPHVVDQVNIYFHKADTRTSTFTLGVSQTEDGPYSEILGLTSSTLQDLGFQNFNLNNVSAQYVRIYGYGNSVNNWNSYEEVTFTGDTTCNTLNNEDYILENDLEIKLIKKDTSLTIFSNKKNLNSLKVYDLLGRVLFNKTVTNSQTIELNTEAFDQGIYILYVNNSEAIKITL